MRLTITIVTIIDDKFNKWSTSDTEFLEKIFKKPIAEIRSVEGNYLSYPERQSDIKKRGKKAKRFLKLHITL